MDYSAPMDSFADMGENPAEESNPNCRLEVDRENRQAIIVWTEYLQFHAELARSDEERFADHVVQTGNRWDDLTEGGWLKPEAERALAGELARILTAEGVSTAAWTVHGDDHDEPVQVWVADGGGDEPSVTFEVVTDYSEGESYESWFDRIGWPVVATLINCTDPGTFNFPYLFSRILYHTVEV